MIRSITLRKAAKGGGFKSISHKVDDKEAQDMHPGMALHLSISSPEGVQTITLPAYKLADMIEELSSK